MDQSIRSRGGSVNKSEQQNEPLAIVGMGVRLPGQSVDVESFWDFLANGRSGIVEVPEDRWDIGRYYSADGSVPGTMVTKWGGFVENLEKFDARFWGITPREAMRMDPQQRWLLEVAWESLEDAGIAASDLRGQKVGVFVGVSTHDYSGIQGVDITDTDAHTNSGITLSIASNRISYLLDLKGPSLSVDTACSSSLVGVSIACRQIWAGECDSALAGGVNVMCAPHATVGFSKASMLSPDGQCFAFDARANGYVRGEGAGMVYFKRLSKALEDNDRIYAVIRASVMNQDGHTSSMTVPGADAQAAMLRRAYREAGVPPENVVYMEAHGTGTPVGDPIELSALGRVLSDGRGDGNECLIGSVKSNIGHLEAGSGIAGLIKAALVLHKDQVPPNANFQTPNPNIPFDQWKLKVATQLQPLPRVGSAKPVTAVNSFGFGGTNSHVVLESPGAVLGDDAASTFQSNGSASSKDDSTTQAERPFVLPISAREPAALLNSVRAFERFLGESPHRLADICYSAGARRDHHEERLTFLGRDVSEMQARMRAWIDDRESESESSEPLSGVHVGRAASTIDPVVFVFTGQGAQWWAMGQQLIEREPIFRAVLEEIDTKIQSLGDFSLIEEMTRDEESSSINDTHIAQPAIFGLQVALAELWKSWGITPSKVVGHSVGEVAAAYVAGVYSLDDACRIIFHRSRLQHTTQGQGKMIAAGVSAREARERIGDLIDRVQIAAVNSANMVTMAGETDALQSIADTLEADGVFFRWLAVDYPFHTHMMQPLQDELLSVLADIDPQPSKIPFVSTVTGGLFNGKNMDAEYWYGNVRNPVLFAPAISAMVRSGDSLFLELGPHPALKSSIEECLSVAGRSGTVLHSLKRKTDETENILSNLAALHLYGVSGIDWAALNQTSPNFVRLPLYQWNRESYWLESNESASDRLDKATHPLLGVRIQASNPTWEFRMDPRVFDYLESHRFWDSILFPAAGYGEISLALARAMYPGQDYTVEDMVVKKALFLSVEDVPTVRVEFNEVDKTYKITSSTDLQDWDLHVEGRLTLYTSDPPPAIDLQALKAGLPEHTSRDQYYKELDEAGFHFGPHFKLISNVYHDKGRALIEVPVPDGDIAPAEGHHFHPILLDACLQVGKAAIDAPEYLSAASNLYLPRRLGRVRFYRDEVPDRFWAYGVQTQFADDFVTFDIEVYDDQGERVCDILGFRTEPMDHIRDADDVESSLYRYQWHADDSDDADSPSADESALAATTEPSSTSVAEPAALADGNFLVFSNGQDVANRVSEQLTSAGASVKCVVDGDGFDIANEADYLRVIGECGELTGIVHCLSLDHSADPALGGQPAVELEKAQQSGVLSALKLIHGLANLEISTRIFFVTRDTQFVLDGDQVTRPISSAINGMARVAFNEHPEIKWKMIDLDVQATETDGDLIVHEISLGDEPEHEIAYRSVNGQLVRHLKRLHHVRMNEFPKRLKNAVQPDGTLTPYQLQIETPGILSNLSLEETRRHDPGPGQLECAVVAAGINFRNVMKALGMPIGNTVAFPGYGEDFSGTVLRVGEGVTKFQPGDNVLGLATSTFRGYVTTDVQACFKKPDVISFADAATIPTVFSTAYYALVSLARMQKGESILIHAGTGGVGQAAIQIAKELGLEIFTTAGTPEKRALAKQLGADHVMDSRTLNFVDDIMRLTDGRGVDGCLNSLSADFIQKSLAVLAPFGRFVEIGKVDIVNNSKIGMELLKNNISYFMFDLIEYIVQRPAHIAETFAELGAKFEDGIFKPLTHKDFEITQAEEAYRYMAQGKHVGKNVLTFESDDIPIGPCNEEGHLFRKDGSYLITGGASGFGVEVANWMSIQGAGHVILMSRSGPKEETALAAIERMRQRGTHVTDARGDVTKLADVQRVVDAVAEQGQPPLIGVIHGAMVLRDEFIADLDDAAFLSVLRPKMNGAWNLHMATEGLPLEHFVCFSSFSAVIGAPKQSNYNAGNVFLEALSHHRQQRGLASITINWGALSGAGFVARNEKTAAYLDAIGMKSINVDEALRVMRRTLQHQTSQVLASRADWNLWRKLIAFVGDSNTFESVSGEQADEATGGSIGPRVLSAPAEQRPGLLMEFIAENMSAVCSIDAAGLDRDTPLTSLGLDSLMAVELMNRIEGEIGLSVPMGKVLAGPSIRELADIMLVMMGGSDGDQDEDAESTASSGGALPPLEIAERLRWFPLSSAQQGYLLPDELSRVGGADIVAFAARIEPALDPAILEAASEFVGKQHPMLRTTISEIDGVVSQRTNGYVDFLTHEAAGLGDAETAEIVERRSRASFDLANGSLSRVELFGTDRGSILLLTIHAIAADRASVKFIVRDLLDAYHRLAAGESVIVEPAVNSYQDFVQWERNHLNTDAARKRLDVLKSLVEGAPALLNLPEESGKPGSVPFQIPNAISHQLMAMAAEQEVSLFETMLSAYEVLLHQTCRQNELLVGCHVPGRLHAELAEMVGQFANTVALRSHVGDDPTFIDLLGSTHQRVRLALANQQYPFARLLSRMQIPESAATRHPVFQATFEMESQASMDRRGIPSFFLGLSGHQFDSDGHVVSTIDTDLQPGTQELTLAIEDVGGTLMGRWKFDGSRISRPIAEQLDRQFQLLLEQIAANPLARISQLAGGEGFASWATAADEDVIRVISGDGSDTEIDPIAESTLSPEIVAPEDTSFDAEKFDRVFLTGATGFLGAYLLQRLLSRTKAEVYCLVRAQDEAAAKGRVNANLEKYGLDVGADADRIHVICGDLTLPQLGMSTAQFDEMADLIDVIIHNGADVNLAADYPSLRAVNVNGSIEVLRLAMRQRLKPTHIVTSYSVLATQQNENGGVVPEGSPLPAFEELANGYAQTKWVVENLVAEARRRGLPAAIYRPGNISGHSGTGAANTGDILHTLILAILHVKAVPDVELSIDLSPVDFVADGVVELVTRPGSLGNTYHLINPKPLRLGTLANWLNTAGMSVDLISFVRWRDGVSKLVDSVPGDVVGILAEVMTDDAQEAEEKLPAALRSRFDSSHTMAQLAHSNIGCRPADEGLLDTYMKHLQSTGFFEFLESMNTE